MPFAIDRVDWVDWLACIAADARVRDDHAIDTGLPRRDRNSSR